MDQSMLYKILQARKNRANGQLPEQTPHMHAMDPVVHQAKIAALHQFKNTAPPMPPVPTALPGLHMPKVEAPHLKNSKIKK